MFNVKASYFGKMQKLNLWVVGVLLISSFLSNTFGQDKNRTSANKHSVPTPDQAEKLLPEQAGAWKASSKTQKLGADQISTLPDGKIYLEYNVTSLVIRFYSNGRIKLAAELFQTNHPSEAYGLATFIRNHSDNKPLVNSENILLAISGEAENPSEKDNLLNVLKPQIGLAGEDLPSLISSLPKEDKIANTDYYIVGPLGLEATKDFINLKDTVRFAGGTQAITGKYKSGHGEMSLIIVEYHTPQLASDGYTLFQKYHESIPQMDKTSCLLKRIGNYVVFAVNISDMANAENIISKITYAPKVYWEGSKLNNIPTQFRPADPLAIEEASQTANMLVRTFYWIGVMIFGAVLIGILVGSSFFYWNRYRRRRLGIDNLFSDAGNTIRLNLDDFLITKNKKNGGHN